MTREPNPAEARIQTNQEVAREFRRLKRLAFPEAFHGLDKICNQSEKGRARMQRYDKSLKGRAKAKRRRCSESYKAAMRRYYLSDKGQATLLRKNKSEKGKARQSRYWKSKKGRAVKNIKDSVYRIRKMGRTAVTNGHIKRIYRRARELRQWFDVAVDHIIPLAKGGLHHQDNLQILYRRENSVKRDKLDFIPSVIFI